MKAELKAADAAMFDVRCLRFDVKARKSSGLRNAEWTDELAIQRETLPYATRFRVSKSNFHPCA